MNSKEQELLAIALDRITATFGKSAVLKGGMVLKLLGSARYTNDLDYIFVPYKSRKQIAAALVKCLQSIPGVTISHSLNSKCLRIILTLGEISVQVEASVALDLKTDVATTKLISTQFRTPRRVVHIVDHTVSLANKLAAWNERRLTRDLYDIWFFLEMGISPDTAILDKRLKRPQYSRLVRNEDYFFGNSVEEFYEFLRSRVAIITQSQVAAELADYLTPDELVGVASLIKAALIKLK